MEQKTMRAMVYDSPKKVVLKTVPMPVSDGTSMIVKVAAVGICGSDVHGNWNWGGGPHTRGIFGHEICGTVADPGARTDLKVGDRVAVMDIDPCGKCKYCATGREDMCAHVLDRVPGVMYPGGFAEYVEVKRADLVRKIPDSMSDIEGALVEPVSVAIHANNRGRVEKGSSVLVCGSGTIGMFAAAVAHARGARRVVITGANPERRKAALAADFIDNVVDTSGDDYHDLLNRLEPDGFDSILECSGLQKVQEGALPHLAIGGTFAIVGFQSMEMKIPTLQVYMKQQTIQGCEMLTRGEFEEAIELVNSKRFDLLRYTRTAPLEQLQACLEELDTNRTPVLKYILLP